MSNANLELVLRIRALVEGLKELGLLDQSITGIGETSEQAGSSTSQFADALNRLEQEQALVQQIDDLEQSTVSVAKTMDDAKLRTAALAKEINAAEAPSEQLRASFESSRLAVKKSSTEYTQQQVKLQKLRRELKALGVSTADIGARQGVLSKNFKDTGAVVSELERRLVKARKEGRKPFVDPTTELQKGVKNSGDMLQELQGELARLVTGAALAKFVTDSAGAVRQAEASFRGLEAVANHSGVGIGAAFQKAADLSADGLMQVSDASKALQNLLSRGYSLDQAVQTIDRLKDAAAFNRAAHLSMSEAVVTATEGLKNENSVLVDNAGVTKNVSILWKEYAKEIDTSVTSLTQQQKVQAEVNGILRETAAQAGNAQKALNGIEGENAKLNKSVNELQVAFGVALIPALTTLAQTGVTVINEFVKPFLGGIEILSIKTAAFAQSVDDMWSFLTSGDHTEAMEALNNINNNFALADEMAADVVDRYEKGLVPAAQNAAKALDEQASAAEAAAAAQQSNAVNANTLSDNLKELGLDLETVSGMFTKTELAGVSAFAEMVSSADFSAQAIERVFDETLGKLASGQSLESLKAYLQAAFDQGIISAEQFERMVDRVNKKLDDLTASADGVSDAFKELGIKSQAELFKLEQSALKAFDTIKTSGTATPHDIQLAFLAYAQRAIEANGGVVTSELKVQAAALGITKELEKMGQTSDSVTRNMSKGFVDVSSDVGKLSRSLHDTNGQLNNIQSNAGGAGAALRSVILAGREEFAAMGESVAKQYDKIVADTAKLYKGASLGMYLKALKRRLDGLRSVNLSGLDNEIDDSTSRIKRMSEAAADARDRLGDLSGDLANELDRMAGNYEAIENRRYAEQLASIQELAAEGGREAQKQAEKARRLAKQLHDQKLAEIRAERDRADESIDAVADRQVEAVNRVHHAVNSLNSADLSPVISQFERFASKLAVVEERL